MDAGAHIAIYLFCHRFARDGQVLDLFPPDERGGLLAARTARRVTIAHRAASDCGTEQHERLSRVLSSTEDLPFAPASFDQIYVLAVGERAAEQHFEPLVRAARSLIKPSGLIIVAIPNRGAVSIGSTPKVRPPDFLDFERLLRRHFPHVVLFAQQPLHGATVSPLGRRAAGDAPLLDDSLLPEGGEPPSHFLALCSPRYQKVDETTIAQLPFEVLADQVRNRVERLEGTVAVIRQESQARAEKIESQGARIGELTRQLGEAERATLEIETLTRQVSELEQQIARRDGLVANAEEASAEQGIKLSKLQDQLHEARGEIRQLERKLVDSERIGAMTASDREDAENERRRVLDELHEARAETKSKQRELDDLTEQLAGAEADVATFHKEAARQRRELVEARDNNRKLELRLRELEEDRPGSDVEAEIERIRAQAAVEREHLERRADDEHRQLLEEIAARESARREANELGIRLREAQSAHEAGTQRIAELEQSTERLSTGNRALSEERDALIERCEQAEQGAAELSQLSQQRGDEIEQQKQAIQMLEARATEAESRAASLSEQLAEIHAGLEEAEANLAQKANLGDDVAELEAALRMTKDERDAAVTRAERSGADLEIAVAERDDARARLAKLEQSHAEAEARIEWLEVEREDLATRAAEAEGNLSQAASAELEQARGRIEQLEREALEGERDQEEAATRIEQLEANLRGANNEIAELRDEIGRMRPNASSAEAARQRALAAETLVAEQHAIDEKRQARLAEVTNRMRQAEIRVAELETVEQELRAHLADTKGRMIQAESRCDQLERESRDVRAELLEATLRMERLDEDLSTAMDNLAQTEMGADEETQNTTTLIRAMKSELRRLAEENETELLRVREDLETELRNTSAQLEARQGELWELREEAVRLRAQVAASAAAAERTGDDSAFQRTLVDQESRIAEMAEQQTALRGENERLSRSLEVRKKNLKILAALLKKERAERVDSMPPPPAEELESAGERDPDSLITRELNIRALIEEAGGELSDELADEIDREEG